MQPLSTYSPLIDYLCTVCSFGDIYLGTNVTTGEEVAMKLESTKRCVRCHSPADVDDAVVGDDQQRAERAERALGFEPLAACAELEAVDMQKAAPRAASPPRSHQVAGGIPAARTCCWVTTRGVRGSLRACARRDTQQHAGYKGSLCSPQRCVAVVDCRRVVC